jgi:ethanolamine transporter EutH
MKLGLEVKETMWLKTFLKYAGHRPIGPLMIAIRKITALCPVMAECLTHIIPSNLHGP